MYECSTFLFTCSFCNVSKRYIINPDYCSDKMGGERMCEPIPDVSEEALILFFCLLSLFTKEKWVCGVIATFSIHE